MGQKITRTPDFFDFGAFWEDVFFRRFLGLEKVGQNPEKSAGGAKQKIRAICWAARRNVRGCRGGKEGFRTPPGSARILARNLKPKILGFARTWQEQELEL